MEQTYNVPVAVVVVATQPACWHMTKCGQRVTGRAAKARHAKPRSGAWQRNSIHQIDSRERAADTAPHNPSEQNCTAHSLALATTPTLHRRGRGDVVQSEWGAASPLPHRAVRVVNEFKPGKKPPVQACTARTLTRSHCAVCVSARCTITYRTCAHRKCGATLSGCV